MIDPRQLLFYLPAVLLAIPVHEFAHALVAYRLGDPTPKYMGRLTLNPFAHMDPIGALMLLFFRFGWAKPVIINPANFRDYRRGSMLVALAGPLANVTLAWLLELLSRILVITVPAWGGWAANIHFFLESSVVINLGLAAFNLIPVPPLDGSKVLMGLLPSRQAWALARMEAMGPVLLVLLVVTGLAGTILSPIFFFLNRLIGRM